MRLWCRSGAHRDFIYPAFDADLTRCQAGAYKQKKRVSSRDLRLPVSRLRNDGCCGGSFTALLKAVLKAIVIAMDTPHEGWKEGQGFLPVCLRITHELSTASSLYRTT
jgi:hypothetical protein